MLGRDSQIKQAQEKSEIMRYQINWTQIDLHKLDSISAENYLTLHVPRNFVFLSAKDCYYQY